MKFKTVVFGALVLVGALYVWHIMSAHGGTAGFRQGLGLSA